MVWSHHVILWMSGGHSRSVTIRYLLYETVNSVVNVFLSISMVVVLYIDWHRTVSLEQ